MPSEGPRAKNWSFTLNNYTQDHLDRLSTPIEEIVYLIYGKETGASGTPHLQGTVCFRSRKRLQQVIELIGQCHCSVTRFLIQSIEYCKKDGDITEWGVLPSTGTGQSGGKRTDLDNFKSSVKDGIFSMKELRELHSSVVASYGKFAQQYVEDNKPCIRVEAHPLRLWQQNLNEILLHEPDPREIIFIVDKNGNQGKSWFARYYLDMHPNAQIVIPGKKADMAYAVDEMKRVFFFDCPRSKQGDFIQYDFLEELKNGYFFCPKYESRYKILKTPHVVVLMNEQPDKEKLSKDRFKIVELF